MTAIANAVVTLSLVGLAIVLAGAAVFKLSDRRRTVVEFEELGVPMAPVLAKLVPLVELATAVALVARPRLGALVATGLLLSFSVVVARVLRSGRTVSCGCFGPIGAQNISAATLGRNGLLSAMAIVGAVGNRLVAPSIEAVIAVTAAGLCGFVVTQLVIVSRRIGRIWSVDGGHGRLASEQGRQ